MKYTPTILHMIAIMYLLLGQANVCFTQQTPPAPSPLDEVWVRDELKNGKPAHLNTLSGRTTDPSFGKIGAAFLKDILTTVQNNAQTIHITHAKIIGDLDLESATIPQEVTLENCIFWDGVNLSKSTLEQNFTLIDCHFRKKVSFRRAKANESLTLDDGTFCSEANFEEAQIQGELSAKNTDFEDISNFSKIQIKGNVDVSDSQFYQGINFQDANISGNFDMQRICVASDSAKFGYLVVGRDFKAEQATFDCVNVVDFTNLKVWGNLTLSKTSFSHVTRTNFTHMDISGDLIVDGAKLGYTTDLSNSTIKGNFEGQGLHAKQKSSRFDAQHLQVAKILKLNNAQLSGQIDLSHSNIGEDFQFNACDVTKKVDFSNLEVQGQVEIKESTFNDTAESLTFKNSTVHRNLSLMGTTFKGRADFSDMKVSGDVFGQVKKIAGYATFSKAKIGGSLNIKEVNFHQSLDLSEIDVSGNVFAEGLKGISKKDSLNVARAKIAQSFVLNKARLKSLQSVNFAYANITGSLHAKSAHFPTAHFDQITIGESFLLPDAIFKGPADFSYAKIQHRFEAIATTFTKTLTMSHATVIGPFQADRCTIRQGGSRFLKLVVQDSLSFNNSQLHTPLYFSDMTVKGNIAGREIKIASSMPHPNLIDLKNLKSEGSLTLHFKDPPDQVLLSGSQVADIDFRSPQTRIIDTLDFSLATISRNLQLEGCFDHLITSQLTVQGQALFSQLDIKTKWDLKQSAFWDVVFDDITTESDDKHKKISIDGMTYNFISHGPGDSIQPLLDFIQKATFSVSNYTNLENHLAQQGKKDQANKVYIEMKEQHQEVTFIDHLTAFVGYGRKPEFAFYWSLLPIVIGCFVFFPGLMIPINSDKPRRNYSRILYSIDLFFPFIDLKSANVWQPATVGYFLLNHMHIKAGQTHAFIDNFVDDQQPLSKALREKFTTHLKQRLDEHSETKKDTSSLLHHLLQEINVQLQDDAFYKNTLFKKRILNSPYTELLERQPNRKEHIVEMNRHLFQEDFGHFFIKPDLLSLYWQKFICNFYTHIHQFLGWLLIPIGLAAVSGILK